MTSSATRQPASTTSTGATTPASISPTGTPHCLIEKTSGARCRGASRPSRWELDGVETACPTPRMNPPARVFKNGNQSRSLMASPMPSAASADLGHAQCAVAQDEPPPQPNVVRKAATEPMAR